MGLPEGDPLGQMQGLQALGQGGEIAVREIPRHTERRQRQDHQHRQQNAEKMLLLWGGVLALRTARRIALFDLSGGKEACPLGLRQTGSSAAHHIQQPEAGVICGGDGADDGDKPRPPAGGGVILRLKVAAGESGMRWDWSGEPRALVNGVARTVGFDADGVPVRPEVRYAYIIERGAVPLDEYGIDDASVVAGRVLLDMARGDFREPETLAGAKALMRRLIQHYLGGQVLQSRRVFTELFAFPGDPS